MTAEGITPAAPRLGVYATVTPNGLIRLGAFAALVETTTISPWADRRWRHRVIEHVAQGAGVGRREVAAELRIAEIIARSRA